MTATSLWMDQWMTLPTGIRETYSLTEKAEDKMLLVPPWLAERVFRVLLPDSGSGGIMHTRR